MITLKTLVFVLCASMPPQKRDMCNKIVEFHCHPSSLVTCADRAIDEIIIFRDGANILKGKGKEKGKRPKPRTSRIGQDQNKK